MPAISNTDLDLFSAIKCNSSKNKYISYRRGGLVLAKRGRLEPGVNILRTLYVYLQPL